MELFTVEQIVPLKVLGFVGGDYGKYPAAEISADSSLQVLNPAREFIKAGLVKHMG